MEEGACLHELGVGGEQNVAKDKRLLKTSDLNPEDQQDEIYALIYIQDAVNLMKIRMDLRLKNSAQQAENMTLSCEIKNLRQTLKDSSRLVDNLADIRRTCAEMEATIRSQANLIRKMTQENQALKARIEEREQDDSLDAIEEEESSEARGANVRTKSWWRRQADKVVKGLGTFRLNFTCCLGMKRAFKRNRVHPITSDVL